MDVGLLLHSLAVTLGAAVSALLLGLPVGVALRVAPTGLRGSLQTGTVAALALPPFFVAGVWMQVVGFAGAWRVGGEDGWSQALPLVCTSLVLGSMLWPLIALGSGGALDRVDPRLMEAHPELAGGALLRHVLWPPARGGALPALALVAALALGNFAVPSLFQARVWPEVVWVGFSTRFDTAAAFRDSWPFLILAAGLAVAGLMHPWRWPGRRPPARAALLRTRLGALPALGLLGLAVTVVGLTLGVPLALAGRQGRFWTELLPSLVATRPLLMRSVAYAAGSATLVMVGGILLARVRWGMVLAPLLVLPGIFPGMLLLKTFSVPPLEGWRGTPMIVFVALTVRYLFLGWWVASRAWRETDPGLHEAARLMGAGVLWRWRHAVWPGGRGALAALWYAVYVLALWDVETLVLVVPPGGDSLALMIFNLLHYGHNPQVSALCFWLGVTALLPLVILGAWRASSGAVRRSRPAGVLGMLTSVLGLSLLSGCSPGSPGDHGSALERGTEPGARHPIASRLFESVQVLGGRGTGPGRLLKPRSVAVDGNGNLFVVDMTGRVQRFDREGRFEALWQMPETDRGKAKGMAFGPGGELWLVEPHYHRVNRFDPQGQLLGQWGEHGTGPGQFWFPRAIAAGVDGDCFVSEYGVVERVQRFRADGSRFLGSFGQPGNRAGEFNRAEGIGTDLQGRVYVADSCNHRIQVFDPTGRWLRAHGAPGQGPGEFSYPYDVRIDPSGRQFVCEFGNSRVQVLDAHDRPEEILGGPGSGPDRMNNPWSLCLGAQGDLYVADAQNHRVLRFARRPGTLRAGGAGGGG